MIKNSVFLFILSFLFITSCNLDGVKTSDDLAENDELINDSLDDLNRLGIDTMGLELIPTKLFEDSIQGKPNDKVYQGSNGLRVEWYRKTNGAEIALNDVVMVNFKARVASGEQFDSNDEIGEPVPLKTNIGMMVKGLEEGLLKMRVGDKGRIMIPSDLAYGEKGNSTKVPPGANLIFEIEIVSKIEPIVLEEGVKVYRWKGNGEGAKIEKNQLITFDYFAYTTGENARLYDNSYKNSEPFSFRLENDNVIDGLHQGMSVLHVNENAFIEIPYSLAYGKKGLLDLVPKKTDVVYDVRIGRVDK